LKPEIDWDLSDVSKQALERFFEIHKHPLDYVAPLEQSKGVFLFNF